MQGDTQTALVQNTYRTGAQALGGRSSHLLLTEGRATGNCRMYDHPVAQAATDLHKFMKRTLRVLGWESFGALNPGRRGLQMQTIWHRLCTTILLNTFLKTGVSRFVLKANGVAALRFDQIDFAHGS